MTPKTNTWIWTTSVAAVTGAIAFYKSVKHMAVEHLANDGAFKEAQIERTAALDAFLDAQKQNVNNPSDANAPTEKKWEEYVEVQKINQNYRNKRRAIIHDSGADKAIGAWNVLSLGEKTNVLGFTAVTSIVAGALTHAISTEIKKPRTGSGKGSSSGCGSTTTSNCSGYSSHNSGHGHGGCSGHGGCGGSSCGH